MLFIKVKKIVAQKVKEYLLKNNLFDKKGKHIVEGDSILFPVVNEFDYPDSEFIKKEQKIEVKKDFKEIIKENLTEEEQGYLKTAFDQIGTIAILEIDEELKEKEQFIAKTLIESNPNILTVLKKASHHGGVFRTQDMQYLAGIETKETITKENGIKLKINVEEVYYSPRLSTDRKRIMQQIKPGEKILCMFSGAAPYPITFAKNTEAKEIIGIEINPKGHELGLENIKLNKVNNVKLLNGDVTKIIPELQAQEENLSFDRILMPLPKSAEDFLDAAISVARKDTIIHFYDFLNEADFEEAYEKVRIACKRANLTPEFIELVKCGQHAPHVFRICLDFKII